MNRSLAVVGVAMAMLTSLQAAMPSLAPDLILFNAAAHTMNQAQPLAEALAVKGNRIVAVGSSANIRALAGPNSRQIDAKLRTVLPGFNDAHVHWLTGGFS